MTPLFLVHFSLSFRNMHVMKMKEELAYVHNFDN